MLFYMCTLRFSITVSRQDSSAGKAEDAKRGKSHEKW